MKGVISETLRKILKDETAKKQLFKCLIDGKGHVVIDGKKYVVRTSSSVGRAL